MTVFSEIYVMERFLSFLLIEGFWQIFLVFVVFIFLLLVQNTPTGHREKRSKKKTRRGDAAP